MSFPPQAKAWKDSFPLQGIIHKVKRYLVTVYSPKMLSYGINCPHSASSIDLSFAWLSQQLLAHHSPLLTQKGLTLIAELLNKE